MREMTFTSAMNETFGRKPGQTLGEFQVELKALGEADRQYFRDRFLIEKGIKVIS